MKKIILLSALISVIVIVYHFSDSAKAPIKDAIANVGDAYLSAEELKEMVPAQYVDLISFEQKIDFVKRWMDDEILYQEALRLKIDKKPEIQKILERQKREILIGDMIRKFAKADKKFSKTEIKAYYLANPNEFKRTEIEIKYAYILTDNYGKGWKIRNAIKKDNFYRIAKEHSLDSVKKEKDLCFVKRNELEANVADNLFNIRVGGTTPPIKYSKGYIIARIIDKQKPGTIKEQKEVTNEIISKLYSKAKQNNLQKRISNARKKYKVAHNTKKIPKNNYNRRVLERTDTVEETSK